jgi:hypothetical protein
MIAVSCLNPSFVEVNRCGRLSVAEQVKRLRFHLLRACDHGPQQKLSGPQPARLLQDFHLRQLEPAFDDPKPLCLDEQDGPSGTMIRLRG